ncbi:MAG: AAA family ATPase [Acidimicrobiia bacterium]
MRGERTSGTATVLFTDLVGSTELMARLGDTVFDDLRSEHFDRLRRAMAACGGHEVKNTGDGLLVTFSSAVDALAAAVAAQQATDRHSRSGPAPVAIRVGLALGEVALQDGDVFGTPVVEAARLVAVARPGQILATTVVKLVAGSRAGVDVTDLPPLQLKGLADPVPVCEVAWESLGAATIPLPPLLGTSGRIFVGRDETLERLTQLWKEAAAGERRLALVAGEPGIGKTRLATALAQDAHAQGALVLAGACDEDLGVPFQPFVEALRYYVAHASEPRLGRYGGELVRLVPELAEGVPGLAESLRSDPETERYRLFDAVAGWLADVSAETPVVLVLDDLHWAAKPTLLLLRHVLRFSEPLHLLVIVTYRDSEVGRGHPLAELLADLRRVEGVERFPLSGLDQASVAAFIEQAAGHALDDEDEALPRVVWTETEGNPFFVAEVLRHFRETGDVEHRDGRWVITAPAEELGIPEGVRDVVGRRLSRLSENTNRILAVASIAGLEFESAVIRTAAEVGDEALFSSLDEAVAARILSEVSGDGARYRFAHALVRATLYDEITAARRVTLHQRVAEAIETIHARQLDDYLPALTHHWSRAAAPAAQTDRAVTYATRAGDRALAQLAHDEAAAYYRQALDLIHARGALDERRLGLLLALGEAERRAGDPAYRTTLLAAADMAQQRGDTDALVRAALTNTRGTLMSAVGQVDDDRVAVLRAALEAIGPDDSPARARLLATLGLELVWGADLGERTGYSDEALAIARRLDDPATLAHVLIARFYTITEPGTVADRLQETAELESVAGRLGDPVTRCRALHLRCRVAGEVADLEEAERCITAYEHLAQELGQPVLGWIGLWYRTGLTLVSGRIAEAERLAARILEAGRRTGQPDAAAYWNIHLFDVRRDQGRLAEFEADVVSAVREFPRLTIVRSYLTLLYCEIDDVEQARRHFEEFAADLGVVAVDVAWMRTMTALAEACAYLGDAPRAAELYPMLTPYADQFSAAAGGLGGAVAHHLGLLAGTLGRYDDAEAHFAGAAETHDRIKALAWLARTRLEWARMLLTPGQSGDLARARNLLGDALDSARELGLGTVERRAATLLERGP